MLTRLLRVRLGIRSDGRLSWMEERVLGIMRGPECQFWFSQINPTRGRSLLTTCELGTAGRGLERKALPSLMAWTGFRRGSCLPSSRLHVQDPGWHLAHSMVTFAHSVSGFTAPFSIDKLPSTWEPASFPTMTAGSEAKPIPFSLLKSLKSQEGGSSHYLCLCHPHYYKSALRERNSLTHKTHSQSFRSSYPPQDKTRTFCVRQSWPGAGTRSLQAPVLCSFSETATPRPALPPQGLCTAILSTQSHLPAFCPDQCHSCLIF